MHRVCIVSFPGASQLGADGKSFGKIKSHCFFRRLHVSTTHATDHKDQQFVEECPQSVSTINCSNCDMFQCQQRGSNILYCNFPSLSVCEHCGCRCFASTKTNCLLAINQLRSKFMKERHKVHNHRHWQVHMWYRNKTRLMISINRTG